MKLYVFALFLLARLYFEMLICQTQTETTAAIFNFFTVGNRIIFLINQLSPRSERNIGFMRCMLPTAVLVYNNCQKAERFKKYFQDLNILLAFKKVQICFFSWLENPLFPLPLACWSSKGQRGYGCLHTKSWSRRWRRGEARYHLIKLMHTAPMIVFKLNMLFFFCLVPS